MGEVT